MVASLASFGCFSFSSLPVHITIRLAVNLLLYSQYLLGNYSKFSPVSGTPSTSNTNLGLQILHLETMDWLGFVQLDKG